MNHAANEQLKNLVFASIVSADNDEFGLSEEDKQEIMNRYEEANGDWEYIFENIKDEKKRKIVTRLFTEN